MDKFHNKLRTSTLMKSLHDLLIHRRSIRKYTQEALSPEAVKTILEAGLLAPSSKRCTPWEFIAVEDKETLARLSECKTSGAKPIAGAALAIVVTADMDRGCFYRCHSHAVASRRPRFGKLLDTGAGTVRSYGRTCRRFCAGDIGNPRRDGSALHSLHWT